MAVDSLATADDLSAFPGAPFDELLVEIAQESVRADAGWHIAPLRTETLLLTGYGTRFLPIPSKRIVSVSAVRYGASLTEYTTGYTIGNGGLYLTGGYWACGPVEVDLVHGYEQTPLDLLPLILSRVRSAGFSAGSVSEVTSDDQRIKFDVSGGTSSSSSTSALDRYRLLDGVA